MRSRPRSETRHAAFAQIGADSELIAASAPARYHESKLRRAQALAPETETGRLAIAELLTSEEASRLVEERSNKNRKGYDVVRDVAVRKPTEFEHF